MKSTPLVALFALGLFSRAAAADAPPTDVVIFNNAQVEAAFVTGRSLLANSSYKVQVGRRDAKGTVEIHEHDTDIFFVTEGSATIVTGGTAVEPTPSGEGQIRAKAITGGIPRHVAKGDIVVIPAGVPHWFTEVDGVFLYYIVKVTK